MPGESAGHFHDAEITAIRELGFLFLEEGVWGKAEVLFRGLISLDARDAFAYLGLANALHGQSKGPEAIQAARQALGARPDYLEAALFLVERYLEHEQRDAARPVLEMASHLAAMGQGSASARSRIRLMAALYR